MLLGELLTADSIRMRLDAQNKTEAIEELVDLLIQSRRLPMSLRQEIIDAVLTREKNANSGMEHGLALPHATTDKVGGIIGALGICPEGISFDSLDGEPARLIILLLLPEGKFAGHVRTLAGIAHLAENRDLITRSLEAQTPEALLSLIQSEEENALLHKTTGSP